MTANAQPQTLGDLLKYEAPNLYSRETDTVAAGQKLALGTVVGRDTTSSKLKSSTRTPPTAAKSPSASWQAMWMPR